MEIIILIIIAMIVAIFLICTNIRRMILNTDDVISFISGLTPDIKLSEIKNPAFVKLRYLLMQNLYKLKYNLRLNIIVLVLLAIGITLLSTNIYHQIRVNQLKEDLFQEKIENTNTVNILKGKYDSIKCDKQIVDIRLGYLLDSLNCKEQENKDLKLQVNWLRYKLKTTTAHADR